MRCPTESWEGRPNPHTERLSHQAPPSTEEGAKGTDMAQRPEVTASQDSQRRPAEGGKRGSREGGSLHETLGDPGVPLPRPRLDASLADKL